MTIAAICAISNPHLLKQIAWLTDKQKPWRLVHFLWGAQENHFPSSLLPGPPSPIKGSRVVSTDALQRKSRVQRAAPLSCAARSLHAIHHHQHQKLEQLPRMEVLRIYFYRPAGWLSPPPPLPPRCSERFGAAPASRSCLRCPPRHSRAGPSCTLLCKELFSKLLTLLSWLPPDTIPEVLQKQISFCTPAIVYFSAPACWRGESRWKWKKLE